MRKSRVREQAPLAAALALAVLVLLTVAARFIGAARPAGSGHTTSAALPSVTARATVSIVLNPAAPNPAGWTPLLALPPGLVLSGDSLAIAPSDGDTAYACVVALDSLQAPRPGVGGANQMWVTHDRGRTWRFAGVPPIPPVNQCFVRVDRVVPGIVGVWGRAIPLRGSSSPALAAVSHAPLSRTAASPGAGAAVSFDGGATWEQPTDLDTLSSISDFATLNGVMYAIEGGALALSADGMHTWRTLTDQLSATGQNVFDFWVHPDDNVLLAETVSGDQTLNLWSSRDQGHSWKLLPAPAFDDIVAPQPAAGEAWTICGAAYHPGYEQAPDETPPNHIACSADEGQTWVNRPLPDLPPAPATPTPTPTQGGVSGSPFRDVHLVAVTPAGVLLLSDDRTGLTSLYSLPAGSDGPWQSLGEVPGGTDTIVAGRGPDAAWLTLWALPMAADPYTQVDPQLAIVVKPVSP